MMAVSLAVVLEQAQSKVNGGGRDHLLILLAALLVAAGVRPHSPET